MKTISINGDEYKLPTRWNELTTRQFMAISALSLQENPPTAIRTMALFSLLGLTVNQANERKIEGEICFYVSNGKKNYLLRTTDILFMCAPLNFMFSITENKKGEQQYQFNSKLFRQLIPSIKIKNETFYGPDDALTNVLFKEFIRCETYFSKFLKDNNPFHADCLIATLYRPQKKDYNPEDTAFDGDRREIVNDFLIEKRAAKFAPMDPVTRQAILFFYEGCKFFLTEKYPHVFDSGESSGGKRQDTFENYMRLVTMLAKNDATQTNAWLDTNLHAVMLAMDNARIEQEELEKLYKK